MHNNKLAALGALLLMISPISCSDGGSGGDQTIGIPGDDNFTPRVHAIVASATCANNCHSGEIIEKIHSSACSTCHDSGKQTVIDTIASGGGECVDCHTDVAADKAAFHHQNIQATTGNCEYCHADPRPDWSDATPGDNDDGTNLLPTQLACAGCHVDISGEDITVNRLSYDANYRNETKTPVHTITGITSGYIYNYGICFSCHGVPAKGQFHGKPDIEAITPDDPGCTQLSKGPGRSTYRVFRSEFHEKFSLPSFYYIGTEFESTCIGFSPTSATPASGYRDRLDIPCGDFNNCSEDTDTVNVPILSAQPTPSVE